MFAGNSNINKLKSLFILFHIVCFCLFLIAGDWRQVETAWTAGIAGSAETARTAETAETAPHCENN